MTEYIYGLLDPTTSQIRYIGRARNPHVRLNEHLRDRTDSDKSLWLRKLKTMRVSPMLVILEEVSDGRSMDEVERQWIDTGFRLGWKLTNTINSVSRYSTKEASALANHMASWMLANHLDQLASAVALKLMRGESQGSPDEEHLVPPVNEPCVERVRGEAVFSIDGIRQRYGKAFADNLISLCAERGGLSGKAVEKAYRDLCGKSMNNKTRNMIREIVILHWENSL